MNGLLQRSVATCAFELKSSFTAQRIAVSLTLALFPPVMLSLLIFETRFSNGVSLAQQYATFISVFLIALVLLLSLLLWATPNVYSELEGKSWTFLASRPQGRLAVYFGKFMASVLVSFSISLVSVSLCVTIMSQSIGVVEPGQLWLSMNLVYFLASLVYTALFSLIGVMFVKRAMVVGAGYLIGFDIFLASLPGALINKFTLRHHLQEIGIYLIGWFLPTLAGTERDYRYIYGQQWPVWVNVVAILGATIAFLLIGAKIITSREYVSSDQT